MKITKETTTVFGLEADELDAVEDDLRLFYKSYKFYYAVDSYDFVHFFLPYLDHLSFKAANIGRLAREGIAYENFFSPSRRGDILLMDEYKFELQRVKQLFIHRIQHALELSENIAELANEIRVLISSGKTLEDLVTDNFEIFFLLLIFCQRKNEVNAKDIREVDFFKFLNGQTYFDTFETTDEDFNDYADELFSADDGQAFVEAVNIAFMRHQYNVLKDMDDLERFKYLDNTDVDIKAIERILSANQRISNHPKYHKTVFYYLSSTPYKSSVLFKLVYDLFGKDLTFLEKFKAGGKSIHRNIMQVFLFNVLVSEYPLSEEMPLKITDMIRQILRNEPAREGLIAAEADASNVLTTVLARYSSPLENHFYNLFIRNYKDSLVEMLEAVQSRSVSDYKDTLKMLKSAVDESAKQFEAGNFQYDVKKFSQLALLKEAIDKRPDNISLVKIRFGEDILRFNYHHLPYIPFIYDAKARTKYRSFYAAMQEISSIDKTEEYYIEQVISFLQDLFNSNEHGSNIKKKIYGFIMLCYIDFLDIHITSGEDSKTNEKSENVEPELIGSLESRLRMVGSFGPEESLKTQAERRRGEHARNARVELYYMLIWLYRRNNLYGKLAEAEEKMGQDGISDARISHGLGLGYASRFYHQGETAEDAYLLDKAIAYLQLAELDYKILLNNIRERPVFNLIMRNLMGVYNAIADSNLRLYYFLKKIKYVQNARLAINEAKQRADTLGVAYDKLAILNNTEAELEYCEALAFFERKEYDLARRKINYAIKRYRKSIDNEDTELHVRWREIGDKIDQLAQLLKGDRLR